MLPLRQRPIKHNYGFTLVELLVVMSIIAVLAGLAVGVQRGVSAKQNQSKAKAEMQAIATALESYKLKYGDYPMIGADTDGKGLYDHLSGAFIMRGTGGGDPEMVSVDAAQRRPVLEVEKLTLPKDPSVTNEDDTDYYFEDPWGNAYIYYYRDSPTATWNSPGYILYSEGPDGNSTSTGLSTGSIETDPDVYFTGDDQDNLVHGFEF